MNGARRPLMSRQSSSWVDMTRRPPNRSATSAIARPLWRVLPVVLCALLGPPIGSLILLAVYYFKYSQAIPLNLGNFLAVLFLLAIPVGYALGAVPALLAVSLYCGLLTACSRLLRRRMLTRVCVAALCGGLATWVWFREWVGASGFYGAVGAFVMAALSLGLEFGIK